MDGMLSQDEINALLNGMDLSDDLSAGDSDLSSADTNEGYMSGAGASTDEGLLSDVERML